MKPRGSQTCADRAEAVRLPSRRRSGFSLLEVVIAMGILAYGLLGAAASQIVSTRFNRYSHIQTEAAYLAEQQMEVFQAMNGDEIELVRTAAGYPNDPNNPIDPDPNDGASRSYNRSWTITPDAPEDGVYTLSVVVSWVNQRGLTRSATLMSVRPDL